MLDQPRPHHYEFAHRALRVMYEADPDYFIQAYASPAAIAFMRVLWGKVCDRLAEHGIAPPEYGVERTSTHFFEAHGIPVVVIEMPTALAPAEAIFVALFKGADGAPRYHTLELGRHVMTGEPMTMACSWSQGSHLNHGEGPEPTFSAYREWLEGFLAPAAG